MEYIKNRWAICLAALLLAGIAFFGGVVRRHPTRLGG